MKQTFKNLHIDKQKLIIKAAFEEFGQYGYEGASTNRLVKTLMISKGSLFKYFDNKLDLFQDLFNIALKELEEYMQAFSPVGLSSKERLIEYASLQYEFLIAYPDYYYFFFTLQKELNHKDLASIKAKLLLMSASMNRQLFNKVGIYDDDSFRDHLILLISAYNIVFMDQVDRNSDWKSLRKAFLEGLTKHLGYVKWRD